MEGIVTGARIENSPANFRDFDHCYYIFMVNADRSISWTCHSEAKRGIGSADLAAHERQQEQIPHPLPFASSGFACSG